MVGSIGQAVQQQFAVASKADFGRAIQNKGVLVAKNMTKAKAVEYKFPYQPDELIGVFGDRKQYRVTMPNSKEYSLFYDEDSVSPTSNADPADRVDPKDPVKQRQLTLMHINVNGETVYTSIGSQPTKQQVIETLTRVFKEKGSFEFYGREGAKDKNDIRNLALPVGQKADGAGQHIKGDKANYDAKYHKFSSRDFSRKLGKDVAARGGLPFSSINIINLKNNQSSYTPNYQSESLYFLVSDLRERSVLTKGGKLSIEMASGSKEPVFKSDIYPHNNQIEYLADASQRNNVEIRLVFDIKHRENSREYVFKPNGTAWLDGKQIVTSILMKDKKRK
jgi:hypothetical protein